MVTETQWRAPGAAPRTARADPSMRQPGKHPPSGGSVSSFFAFPRASWPPATTVLGPQWVSSLSNSGAPPGHCSAEVPRKPQRRARLSACPDQRSQTGLGHTPRRTGGLVWEI